MINKLSLPQDLIVLLFEVFPVMNLGLFVYFMEFSESCKELNFGLFFSFSPEALLEFLLKIWVGSFKISFKS